MKPSCFFFVVLVTPLVGLLLGACEPIQVDILLGHQQPPQGTPPPDAGLPPDGGIPDAGPLPQGPPDAGPCMQTQAVEGDGIGTTFTFDSQAIGHFAISHFATSKDWKLYVGSTRPGDVPIPAGDLLGYPGSLVVDSEGTRHLLFTHSDLTSASYYSNDRGGTWQQRIEVVRESYPVDLKVDASGFAHAIFSPSRDGKRGLAYATNLTGPWVVTDLGIRPRNGRADLTLDAQGNAHIAYLIDSSGMYYATNASGAWVFELAAEVDGNEPVIAIAPLGPPHLLYSVGGVSGEHAVKQDGRWTVTPVGAAHGIAIDLVVDKAGNLHALLDSPNPRLSHATLAAGSRTWSTSPLLNFSVPDGESYLVDGVLGVDAAGKAHVGFRYNVASDTEGIAGTFFRYAQPCP